MLVGFFTLLISVGIDLASDVFYNKRQDSQNTPGSTVFWTVLIQSESPKDLPIPANTDSSKESIIHNAKKVAHSGHMTEMGGL
jgi:hypothetical protein